MKENKELSQIDDNFNLNLIDDLKRMSLVLPIKSPNAICEKRRNMLFILNDEWSTRKTIDNNRPSYYGW